MGTRAHELSCTRAPGHTNSHALGHTNPHEHSGTLTLMHTSTRAHELTHSGTQTHMSTRAHEPAQAPHRLLHSQVGPCAGGSRWSAQAAWVQLALTVGASGFPADQDVFVLWGSSCLWSVRVGGGPRRLQGRGNPPAPTGRGYLSGVGSVRSPGVVHLQPGPAEDPALACVGELRGQGGLGWAGPPQNPRTGLQLG